MPKNSIYETYSRHGRGRVGLQVAWRKNSRWGVTLSGFKFPDGVLESECEPRLTSLVDIRSPKDIDKLIKTLKKARRQVWD